MVAAGILWREGRILICRRRASQDHALKWEFPGGKLESGESPAQALVRELREELGIEASPPVELTRYTFAYPGRREILLVFLEVPGWRGEIVNHIFERIEWAAPGELTGYDFLEGDVAFLQWLHSHSQRASEPRP